MPFTLDWFTPARWGRAKQVPGGKHGKQQRRNGNRAARRSRRRNRR